MKKSLRERRALLHSAFTEAEGEFAFAQFGNTSDLEQIQTLLDESVKSSCEGLMVKMLDTEESGYEPSKRSRNWLKVRILVDQQLNNQQSNFRYRSRRIILQALVTRSTLSSLVHTSVKANERLFTVLSCSLPTIPTPKTTKRFATSALVSLRPCLKNFTRL